MSEIIVGVEPGRPPEAEDALALGSLLARASGARLLAVSVVGPDGSLPAAERELGLALAETTARLGSLPPVDALALPGTSPSRALHELGQDRACDAIVLGSSRRAAHLGLVPGLVAVRLLQGGVLPVAVATRGFGHASSMSLGTVGVAFIDTPEARAAVTHAARLAKGAGARLRIVTVFDGLTALAPVLELDRGEDRARARRALDAVGREAGGDTLWLEGDALDELTNATAELDLLVVGSRGYGSVRAVLLGGVSDPLLRQAACPVLVVPRPDHSERRAAPDTVLSHPATQS